jgi:hypothetical protein
MAIVCGVCLFASTAMAQDASNEFWPEIDTFVKLNENSRLFFLSSVTRVKEQGYSDGGLGVHLDVFANPLLRTRMERATRRADIARHKFIQLRIGYLYSRSSKSSSSQFSEHTPTLEVSHRYYFPKNVLITNRVRGDFRFLDGVFTPRLRDRVKLERSIHFRRTALTPYIHAEAFYDWRYDVWHRFRYSAGAEWELNRRVVLEGYFLRQRDNRSSTKYVNAVGVALQFYIR